MPKLIASSVGENRRSRYASLLEASVAIALDQGGSAVTITAVAKKAARCYCENLSSEHANRFAR